MERYIGGNRVPGGYYLNARRWTITPVADAGAKLAGDPSETYLRIHWLAALLLAPILGGLFVVFLPFIGFAMFFEWAFLKATGKAAAGARDLAATVTPGWVPGEAHLTGRAVDPKHPELPSGGAGETALHDVAEEIARKRAEEEKDG